jgi:DeoR family transcriptional regulator, aga operon transcriptional repressor
MVGPTAIETLSHFVMDKLFISATGVDPEHGATIIQPEEAGVFRAMTRQAEKRIVVADSSKLGLMSPAVVCTPREIDLLITDNGISEELLQKFAAAGVSVLAV